MIGAAPPARSASQLALTFVKNFVKNFRLPCEGIRCIVFPIYTLPFFRASLLQCPTGSKSCRYSDRRVADTPPVEGVSTNHRSGWAAPRADVRPVAAGEAAGGRKARSNGAVGPQQNPRAVPASGHRPKPLRPSVGNSVGRYSKSNRRSVRTNVLAQDYFKRCP